MFPKEFLSKTLDILGPYGPDAVLTFTLFVAAVIAIWSGIDPLVAGPLAFCFCLIYSVRRTLAEKHQERIGEQEVQKEVLSLQKIQERERTKLEKERLKSLPPSGAKRKKS